MHYRGLYDDQFKIAFRFNPLFLPLSVRAHIDFLSDVDDSAKRPHCTAKMKNNLYTFSSLQVYMGCSPCVGSRWLDICQDRGQYPAILTEQARSINDVLCWKRTLFSCGTQRVIPSVISRTIKKVYVSFSAAQSQVFPCTLNLDCWAVILFRRKLLVCLECAFYCRTWRQVGRVVGLV